MLYEPLLIPGACLLAGLLLGWAWRSLTVARLQRQLTGERELRHELELDHAGLDSAHELLRQQLLENASELSALREQRERWQAERARAQSREEWLEQRSRDQLEALRETRRQLQAEFEHLANRIFEERGRHLGETHNAALQALLQPFREQIQRFQARVDDVHRESVAGQASLAEQLKQLQQANLQMSDQADSLSRALTGDKKTTGNWGEIQLERALELAGLQRGVHYEAQAALYSTDGKRLLPDFLVKLPDGKHLVVDSKVSLVDYQRAVAAEDEDTRIKALKAHVAALRRHIDSLASKDYAALPGLNSPSMVFLFMPVEAAFVEALRNDSDLFNYGHRHNVVLTSPTTLLPMLRTVANLWIAYQSDSEARAIADAAGEIFNKVVLLSQRLDELGRTLSTAVGKYNQTVTALVGKQGLQGKVERFRSVSANARGELPEPATQHPAVDFDRLSGLRESNAEDAGPNN